VLKKRRVKREEPSCLLKGVKQAKRAEEHPTGKNGDPRKFRERVTIFTGRRRLGGRKK